MNLKCKNEKSEVSAVPNIANDNTPASQMKNDVKAPFNHATIADDIPNGMPPPPPPPLPPIIPNKNDAGKTVKTPVNVGDNQFKPSEKEIQEALAKLKKINPNDIKPKYKTSNENRSPNKPSSEEIIAAKLSLEPVETSGRHKKTFQPKSNAARPVPKDDTNETNCINLNGNLSDDQTTIIDTSDDASGNQASIPILNGDPQQPITPKEGTQRIFSNDVQLDGHLSSLGIPSQESINNNNKINHEHKLIADIQAALEQLLSRPEPKNNDECYGKIYKILQEIQTDIKVLTNNKQNEELCCSMLKDASKTQNESYNKLVETLQKAMDYIYEEKKNNHINHNNANEDAKNKLNEYSDDEKTLLLSNIQNMLTALTQKKDEKKINDLKNNEIKNIQSTQESEPQGLKNNDTKKSQNKVRYTKNTDEDGDQNNERQKKNAKKPKEKQNINPQNDGSTKNTSSPINKPTDEPETKKESKITKYAVPIVFAFCLMTGGTVFGFYLLKHKLN
ncbi:hypothetical protein COBT_001384 [Conglomerata obtusa]